MDHRAAWGDRANDLEQSAQGRLIGSGGRELSVPTTMCYRAADPLAVHLVFPAEVSLDGRAATWTFARSLLDEGLRAPAGRGDVLVWPCGDGRTALELHSPYGMALLRYDTADLRRFLLRSYAVVAPGDEDLTGEVERGLQSLFRNV
jgi:hypothetical protein